VPPSGFSADRLRLKRAALFLIGLAIGLVMVARSQVSGDQLNLLARGWLFAEKGQLIPYGLPTSAGGNSPGSLTSLLVGLPLVVWRDYRAPTMLVFLCHVAAYLLLDRTLRGVLSGHGRTLFAVFFWLNPWRLHFSGFLWNANYLVMFGALHLWTVRRQRRRASFWLSFVHVLAIGAMMQLHSSFVILALATVLLAWRGYFKPHWLGAACGALVVAGSLVPWLLAVRADPSLMPSGTGFLGRGLVLLFPLVRGVLYWLRYPSLSFSGTGNADMTTLDFASTLGSSTDAALVVVLGFLTQIVGPATLLLPLLANGWLWRRVRRGVLRRLPEDASDRCWLLGYVRWVFVAMVVSAGLSPTTIMAWQGFSVLHAAVLAVVLYLMVLGHTRLGRAARLVPSLYAWLAILLLVAMAFGAPHYRVGGRHAHAIALRADHPMLPDLGIDRVGSVTIDSVNGWWPDALPRPAAPAPDRR